MKQLLITIIGLLIVMSGIVLSLLWWSDLMVITRGLLGILVVLSGAVIIGVSRK